jgi:Ca-activated chloride channel family protein
MNESIEHAQFVEWVEQYANDTISPEDAEQLLKLVQSDPEKLEILRTQLQADRLLEIMHKRDSMGSIAEAVLKRTKAVNTSKGSQASSHSRILLKIAASLAILLGFGSLMLPRMSGQSDRADELVELAKQKAEAVNRPIINAGTIDGDSTATPEPQQPRMKLIKPKVKVKKSAKPKEPTETLIADDELVPLQVEYPKPLYAGTPTAVVSDNLEGAPSPDLMAQGVDFYRAGKLAEAEAAFKEALNEDPYNREAMEYLKRSATKMAANEVRMQRATRAVAMSDVAVAWNPAPTAAENYAKIVENEFNHSKDQSLSTFSIDVDTASYANVRRFLSQGKLPPKNAVRLEEMINYFEYDYEGPKGAAPFSTAMALTDCPWNKDHQLLRVGLQGRKIDEDDRKPSNLVFLLDVSGSMNSTDKLPLLKTGFEKMVRALGEKDRVAIVVYAGSSGVVLDSTSALDKETIIGAMNRLKAGGSTAGGAGIELAYRLATDHFIKEGINRVILATDGDFNVGISNIDALQQLIEEKRKTGVFLSVLGFGTGNLQDAKMEMLANKGNGNYFYIDSEREAEKVLVKELTANMVTIAKDVKIQVEFNPALVRSYRLIGYENRVMAARDFADDTKDAGEIGAGHQVTALYELVPAGAPATEDGVPLKYTKPAETEANPVDSSELLTLKLRYKQPEGSNSELLTFTLDQDAFRADAMDESFRWATAIAAFGMHLRESGQIGSFSMDEALTLAKGAIGEDEYGYRKEAVDLMIKAYSLSSGTTNGNDYPQWQYR